MRLASLAWTWADLAEQVSLEGLVVAGGSLLLCVRGAQVRPLGFQPGLFRHRRSTSSHLSEAQKRARGRESVRGG